MSKAKLFVFLHGYDSCGDAMKVLDASFKKIAPEGSMFLYPDAPFKTNNGKGYNWFTFVFGDDPFAINEEYIFHSMQLAMPYLSSYINNQLERYNFKMEDVVLVGFSQGAGLAVHASCRLGSKICCAISFSGGLANPNGEILKHDIKKQHCPVCFIHGEDDPILPQQFSKRGNDMLLDAGFESEFYLLKNTKHIITPEAMKIAENFLKKHFNK